MFINNDVTNFGGLPAGGSGTLAQRPAAGLLGRIYIATDTLELYRDTGTVWTTIGGPGSGTVTGTGTVNEITFWNGAGSIGSLSTAIYPSLTELSYVKGVTSGIQTQINGKQDAIILTTSGTSGPATFIANTLNVPQYQAALTNPVTGTGVSGQAAFWTGTNAISGDNDFHWDNINKRLGINTVNPGARLDIHGTGVIAQLNGTGVNNAFLAFQSAGVTQWQIGNTAAPSNFTINDTNGNEILNVTQSGIFSFKFPTGALMSINSVAGGDGISINPVGTNSGFLSFKSGTFRVGINSTNQFVIRTAGTDLLSVTSSGQVNVGGNFTSTNNTLQVAGNTAIGYTTAAPTNGLIVAGNVGIGTTSPNTILQANFSSATAYSSGATGNGLTLYNTNTTTNQYVGLFLRGEPSSGNEGQASIYGITTGTGAMDMAFSTRGSFVLAERMRITSAGNVGIGTTGPAARLEVVGSGGIRVNEDGVGTKVISIRSDFSSIDPAINVSTNNALLLQTNNTERMRITSGGNVGIDYNPNVKLAVNGSIYQGSNTANALYDMLCNGNLYTGGITPTILTVTTTPYTIARTATGYKCDSGASVLDLPSASGLNNLFFIINNSGGNLTVNRNGSDTILNLSGTAVTSLTISNNQRALIYMGGGTQSYLIFQA